MAIELFDTEGGGGSGWRRRGAATEIKAGRNRGRFEEGEKTKAAEEKAVTEGVRVETKGNESNAEVLNEKKGQYW